METMSMRDQYNREINYMRVSVTQDCNLKCIYCSSGENSGSDKGLMLADDIQLICTQAVKLGIRNYKITGGEPLLRYDVTDIVGRIKNIPGVESVTLTTNGIFLKEKLNGLISAGLDSVNISLDTLNREKYKKITGFDGLYRVLEAIEESKERIYTKINVVLLQDVNEQEWYDFISYGKEHNVDIRFIELMPIGDGILKPSVNNKMILNELKNIYPEIKKVEEISMEDKKHAKKNGPAVYYSLPGSLSRVGFISAVNNRFCSSCNRIRLTSKGELKGCLCYEKQEDLSDILSNTQISMEEKEKEILERLRKVIYEKPLMHHFEDSKMMTETSSMKEIGG